MLNWTSIATGPIMKKDLEIQVRTLAWIEEDQLLDIQCLCCRVEN